MSTPPGTTAQRLISGRIAGFVRDSLALPLTARDDYDIFYPCEDGEGIAESPLQFIPLTETVHILERHFRNRPDVFVAGAMFVYYRMNDNRARVAPDVFVVFGVDKRQRDSFIVWREGGNVPVFVLEVCGSGTYIRDMTEKRATYAALGVAEYWRFDPTGELFTPPLEGERLKNGEYQPIEVATDPQGILRGHSSVLNLEVCIRPNLKLRLFDPSTGTWLRNLDEAEDALALARQNLAQAARIRELEAQLQQQGIAPPNPSQ